MNHVILEKDGKLWYSDSYIIEQMERAYKAGLHNGFKTEFHTVIIMDSTEQEVEQVLNSYREKIKEEFYKALEGGHIWKKASKYDKEAINRTSKS